MEKDLRELRVFMASPSDLTDERDALRDLERRLNSMFRDRGVRVSIEGWEEVQPDAGAPQDLINPLVHGCDVFVGLLNARWGTPTDSHSSGFSEEFNIALERRKKSGITPTIGMYFRDIDPELLRDKGPQLEAVLAFKERVEAERIVLHKRFSAAHHLALEVMNFLLPHALRLADEVSASAADLGTGSSGSTPSSDEPEAREAAESKSDDEGSRESTSETDSAQRQITSALASFSNLFSAGEYADPKARDRVLLAALAFAEDAGTLGSHHVNRLFRDRKTLDLTLGEIRIWFRTYFESYGRTDREQRTVPLWGVVDLDRVSDRVVADIGALASDSDPNVVRGALSFMTEHKLRPASIWEPDPAPDEADGGIFESRTLESVAVLWASLFQTVPGIDSALNYLVTVAGPDDAKLFTKVAESDALDDRTRNQIRVALNVMSGKSEAIADIAPTRYSGKNTSSLRDLVVASISELSAEQWGALLAGTDREIAVASALQIVEHEKVSADQLKTISELRSVEVEKAIVDRARRDAVWAAEQIKELTGRDKYENASLVSRILAVTLPESKLEALDARATLDATAWVALTIKNPGGYLESARHVLDGTANWLNERNAPLLDKYAALANHTAATARGAACTVLSQASELVEADVERIVTELRRDSYLSRSPALRALVAMAARFDADGEHSLPDLGDLSVLDSYGFTDELDLVLNSPLARFVVPIWRDSNIQTIKEASRSWELRRNEISDRDLEEALYLESETLRMVALDQLMSRWTEEQLGELLNRYGDQDRQWWYNIVAGLDERLHGFSRNGIDDWRR